VNESSTITPGLCNFTTGLGVTGIGSAKVFTSVRNRIGNAAVAVINSSGSS
jgi:hypothetical protein